MPASWARGGAAYLWEPLDKLISKRLSTCLLDACLFVLLRRVFPLGPYEAVRDVFEDGVVEKEGLLLNKTDLRPPPEQIHVLERTSTDLHDPVTEPQDLCFFSILIFVIQPRLGAIARREKWH